MPAAHYDAAAEPEAVTARAPAAVHADPAPMAAPPVAPEPVVDDLSHVHYEHIEGGYAAPPLARPASDELRSGAQPMVAQDLATHATTLPAVVLDEVLHDLGEAEREVSAALRGEPAAALLPLRRTADRGYGAAAPHRRFMVTGEAGALVPRTLDRIVGQTDPFDRIELVRLVSGLLGALHARDCLTSGVALTSFACALDPRPAVVWLHPAAVRRLGGEFVDASSGGLHRAESFDEDRFEFAVLAHQLLVSVSTQRPDSFWVPTSIPGLTGGQVRCLEMLWGRAAGSPGTRPQVGAWMEVLGA